MCDFCTLTELGEFDNPAYGLIDLDFGLLGKGHAALHIYPDGEAILNVFPIEGADGVGGHIRKFNFCPNCGRKLCTES